MGSDHDTVSSAPDCKDTRIDVGPPIPDGPVVISSATSDNISRADHNRQRIVVVGLGMVAIAFMYA